MVTEQERQGAISYARALANDARELLVKELSNTKARQEDNFVAYVEVTLDLIHMYEEAERQLSKVQTYEQE